MDHLNVVTAFLNPEIDNDDMYMTLTIAWPQRLNTHKIILILRKAVYGFEQALWLWHDNFNEFLLSPEFPQSLAYPNLFLQCDCLLILLYVDDISMFYPEATAKAAIEVTAKLSEKYKIKNLGPAQQYLGIKIHCNGIGVSMEPKAYITTILRQYGMAQTQDVSTPMDSNVKLDLAEAWGEMELEDVTDY